MSLQCPSCGTEQTQSVPMAYEQGTARTNQSGHFVGASGSVVSSAGTSVGVIGGGLSLSGTQQSNLAKRLAPPVKQEYTPGKTTVKNLGIFIAMVIVFVVDGPVETKYTAESIAYKQYKNMASSYPVALARYKISFERERSEYPTEELKYRRDLIAYTRRYDRLKDLCASPNAQWMNTPMKCARALGGGYGGTELRKLGYRGEFPGPNPVEPSRPVWSPPQKPINPGKPDEFLFRVKDWGSGLVEIFLVFLLFRNYLKNRKARAAFITDEDLRYKAAMQGWYRRFICLRCGTTWDT